MRQRMAFVTFLFLFFSSPLWAAGVVPSHPHYNIILIINDQEAYHLLTDNNPTAATEDKYVLPAREEIHKRGITFTNHYTAAAMCSPSRASLLTGVPPQIHSVFDQEEYSYVPVLDPKRPNMGSVLKSLGYRTAYFGKFEMDKKLLEISASTNYSTLAKPYGFDTFNFDGDVGGSPLQGYTHDIYFVGEAVRWLRKNAHTDKKPFFMVVSLLNPHDIMYGDANIPNTPEAQISSVPVIFPPPANALYAKKWAFTLPNTLEESLTTKGMPNALLEYKNGWSGTLGFIPTARKDMWSFYYNYYLNVLRDNDHSLQLVINALNQMDLWKNTIIIFTADHGEMGGAHGGLRGKGPMAYEENSHIPLVIDHPDAPHGVTCQALTSHLDLLPTLVGLSGLPKENIDPILKKLPGHNFADSLHQPEQLSATAFRPGILFNYVGISTIDGTYLQKTLTNSFSHKKLPPLSEVNLNKRGFLMFVFDGRYKFARFYSPNQFNTPTTFDEIIKNNDTQLFDLKEDPAEENNLMLEASTHKDLILKMNSLLNDLLTKEVGKNEGTFLPKNLLKPT